MRRLAVVLVLALMSWLLCQGAGMMGYGDTLRGIRAVVRSEPGTFILQSPKGDMLALFWPKGGGYGFAVFGREDAVEAVRGLRAQVYSISEMVKAMESVGWRPVGTDALPAEVVEAATSLRVLMRVLGSSLWTMPMLLAVDEAPEVLATPVDS